MNAWRARNTRLPGQEFSVCLCLSFCLLLVSCVSLPRFSSVPEEGGVQIIPASGQEPSPEALASPAPLAAARPAGVPEPEPRETPAAITLPGDDTLQPVPKVPESLPPVSPTLSPRAKGQAVPPPPPLALVPAPLSPVAATPAPPAASLSPAPEPGSGVLEHFARLLARKDFQRAYEMAKSSGWLDPPREGTAPPLLQRVLVAYLQREAGQADRWEKSLRAILQEETKIWPLTLDQLDLCDAEPGTGQLRPRATVADYRPGEFVYLRARLRNFATLGADRESRQLTLTAALSLLTPDRRATTWELLPPDKRRACVSLALVPDYISVPIWFRLPANLPAGPYLLQVNLRDENKTTGASVEKILDLKVTETTLR